LLLCLNGGTPWLEEEIPHAGAPLKRPVRLASLLETGLKSRPNAPALLHRHVDASCDAAASLREPGMTAEDFASLRLCRSGGDKVPAELEKEFNALTGHKITKATA
jgi:hypothetical protein